MVSEDKEKSTRLTLKRKKNQVDKEARRRKLDIARTYTETSEIVKAMESCV